MQHQHIDIDIIYLWIWDNVENVFDSSYVLHHLSFPKKWPPCRDFTLLLDEQSMEDN